MNLSISEAYRPTMFPPFLKTVTAWLGWARGVSPDRERAIAEDSTGTLWLATWYSGVHRFDPGAERFTLYRSSDRAGSHSNDAVAAITVDHSGIVWAGTENGLNRLDPATG